MLSWLPCSACRRRCDPNKAAAKEHRAKGHNYVKKQEYQDALTAYSKAISSDSGDATLWVCRASVYEALQDWQQSLRDANRAVQLDPANQRAIYAKVLALRKMGKIEEALTECQKVSEVLRHSSCLEEMRSELQEVAEKEKKNREAAQMEKEAPSRCQARGSVGREVQRAGAKPAVKADSLDYRRFNNIVDSDEEAEEKPLGAEAWTGPNPTLEERLGLTEDMLEVCRKSQQETARYFSDKQTSVRTKLPPDHKRPVGVLTVKELGEYKCSSDRMLVSIYGDIYDVSARPDLYGYGPKSFHAGKDITWGVVVGKESAENCNRFYDIFKLDDDHRNRFLQIICQRMVSFEDEFGEPVGRLEAFVQERDLPPAPKEEIEECTQQ